MNAASLASSFAEWLDAELSRRIPEEVRAFNFNLYVGFTGKTWDVELAGAASYDPANPDWACDPIFSSPELFFMPQKTVGEQWEQALAVAIELITIYLRDGRLKDVLRDSIAVGVGFVDGDLTILWPENAA